MDSIQTIQSLFEKYTSSYQFYFKDLQTGKDFELGSHHKKYPICSCFKLAVLMAYFDSIQDASDLDQEVLLHPNHFSPGGGMVNYLNTAVKFTHLQLAQLMIAFSDGTATDYFMNKLGVAQVQKTLQDLSPESSISKTLKEMVNVFNHDYLQGIATGQSKAQICQALFQNHFQNTDYIHGRALAMLAWNTYQRAQAHRFAEPLLAILHAPRALPRTAMFNHPKLKYIGKSGSLGFGYFMNDSGVILHENKILGYFGYTSEGWVHSKELNEIVLGLIGTHLAHYFQIPPAPHSYSPQTMELLE